MVYYTEHTYGTINVRNQTIMNAGVRLRHLEKCRGAGGTVVVHLTLTTVIKVQYQLRTVI